MPDWRSLVDAFNATLSAGTASVDASVLRLLFRLTGIFASLSVALLLTLLAVLGRLRAARRRVAERAALRPPAEELQARLAEMVRKTNDRNNYINSIFSSIENGLLLVDRENRVVLYNPMAMTLLGVGPSVFFTERGRMTLDGTPLAPILDACLLATAGKKSDTLELRTADGKILDVRVSPIVDKYTTGTDFGSLAVVTDVTELRKLENLRRDFVANVSHEFRTPLTLISGFIELFRMNGEMQLGDRSRAFEIMEIETERLKRLVSELLTLSEIESVLPHSRSERFAVERLLSEVVSSLGPLAAAKHQEMTNELDLDGVELSGNENWFFLAIKNLVENAIKYTPAGGRIHVTARRDDGDVVISVVDSGIGIEASEREKIFERFYRIEKSRGSGSGGSGLGLALVRDIVSIFDGAVDVASTPGMGSIFTVILPIEGAAEEAAE